MDNHDLKVGQFDIVLSTMKMMDKVHGFKHITQRQLDAIAKVSTILADAFNKPFVKVDDCDNLLHFYNKCDEVSCVTLYFASLFLFKERKVEQLSSVVDFKDCLKLVNKFAISKQQFIGVFKKITDTHWIKVLTCWDEWTQLATDGKDDELDRSIKKVCESHPVRQQF